MPFRLDDGVPIYTGTPLGRVGREASPGEILGFVVGIGVATAIFVGGLSAVRWIYSFFLSLIALYPQQSGSALQSIGVGLTVLAIGGLLFVLKERKRAAYAYLELGGAVGMAIEAWARIGTSSLAGLVASLLAAVYVVVCGFDDLAKARADARQLQAIKVNSRAA